MAGCFSMFSIETGICVMPDLNGCIQEEEKIKGNVIAKCFGFEV